MVAAWATTYLAPDAGFVALVLGALVLLLVIPVVDAVRCRRNLWVVAIVLFFPFGAMAWTLARAFGLRSRVPRGGSASSGADRPSRGYRVFRVFQGAVLAIAVTTLTWRFVADRLDDVDFRPRLEQVAAQAQDDGEHVGTVPVALANRWSNHGGPRYEVAAEYAEPGNARLEPVFDELTDAVARESDGFWAVPSRWSCVYLPAVPRAGDRTGEAVQLVRLCYASTRPGAHPMGYAALATERD